MQPCPGCRVTGGNAPFLPRPGFPSLSAEVAGPPSAKPSPRPDSGSTGTEQASLAEAWARSSGLSHQLSPACSLVSGSAPIGCHIQPLVSKPGLCPPEHARVGRQLQKRPQGTEGLEAQLTSTVDLSRSLRSELVFAVASRSLEEEGFVC